MTAIPTPAPAVPRDQPRVIWSWALYDWANSAFTTLVVTFVYSTYFVTSMVRDPQTGAPDIVGGTAAWSRAVAVSALLTALLSPVLGAAADRAGLHKRLLLIATLGCVTATAALTFVSPTTANAALIALVVFVVADVCFETGYVFYNAFLPQIASPERIGRVSGFGWGLGYAGGLVCLAIALVGFAPPIAAFGLPTADGFNYRATNLLVAVWFLMFAVPLFVFVPERRFGRVRLNVRGAIRELAATIREVRRYREVVAFLAARLIYNDGLVTIFAFGGIYAAGTFGMSQTEVLLFGVVINVAAGIGALVFGYVDDRIGGKRTVMITLLALGAGAALAAAAQQRLWLWVAAVVIGVFSGPNQAASRSLMARFVPESRRSEFFGFFAFSGKATAFLGPALFGAMTGIFQSQRAGVAAILLFFAIGAAVLALVNEQRGVAMARD